MKSDKQIQEAAEMLLKNEVYQNQGCLVEMLIKNDADGFGVDDIEGLYADPTEWEAERCREWLDDHGIDYPGESNPFDLSRADLVEVIEGQLGGAAFDHESNDELAECLLESTNCGDWGDVEHWRDQVRDNAEAREVMQWWSVSARLLDDLRKLGYVVIDNDYGGWWGRTTCGQAVIDDGVLQNVARLIEKRIAAL